MPELDYITVKGYKSLANVEKLELGPINVLIGANGSGKSNFVNAFAFLHAIREGRLQSDVERNGGAENLLHFGSKQTARIELKIAFQNEVNQYEIHLIPTTKDSLAVELEDVFFWDKAAGHPEPFREHLFREGPEAGISRGEQLKGISLHVWKRLSKWRLYHFHDTSSSSSMKKTVNLEDNLFFRADGSNLAAFLYLLRETDQSAYDVIRRTIQRVTPFFGDFNLKPSRINADKIRLEWSHVGSDQYFDASSLSDGTLRFMCLATLFLQPSKHRPSVILIDEPELGLHPYAITMLGSLIRSASSETQVIVSTQSPLLLDQFEPEEVLVADRVDDATRLNRLDSKELESWLENYSLGELWEKNHFGGRPTHA